MSSVPPNPALNPAPKGSLIAFPCAFPIKVMGLKTQGFANAMAALAQQFDATFDAARMEQRDSRTGRYQSLTLTIQATSQVQLDNAYRAFSSHPMVKVVL